MRRTRVFTLTLIVLLAVLGISSSAFSMDLPEPIGHISDYVGVLSGDQKSELDTIVKDLKDNQGIELAIAIVDTTKPYDSKEYTTELFNEWGIGGPEDSGLLILLAVSDRRIEVEPGYGLEGALPDGLIGSVLDRDGAPHFKKNNFGKGILEISKTYAGLLAGEEFESAEKGLNIIAIVLLILLLFLVLVFIFAAISDIGSTGGGTTHYGRGSSKSSSRSSGGGFGGFGGGMSGGGGAGRGF